MRQFNVGDIVDWDEHNGNNRGRYQPGPYVVAEILGPGMGIRLERIDGSPLFFNDLPGQTVYRNRHAYLRSDYLRLEPFLDAARKANLTDGEA